MEKIDNLDRQILEIIMRNARIPSKDVAIKCGVSRAAIHQRIQRMIDMGVIVGSGYHVNPKSLGYRTCTYIGVKLEKGSMYKDVVPELEKIPEVVECHFTTGPYTMLCKLFARDNEHLMELLNGKIQKIHGVTETETLICLEQSIHREIPIRKQEEK
ncbi:MAG: Lrp/AsnC ligand binding domain-containing protein [Coprobacter sp.]|nr:Lrp/AsnC ligand binding domain-containing protein [Coprobacter sp.]